MNSFCNGENDCIDKSDEYDGCNESKIIAIVNCCIRDNLSYIYTLETIQEHLIYLCFIDHAICQTTNGIPCDYPFSYGGNFYDTCINIDSGGKHWCYSNATIRSWGYCDSESCPQSTGK